MDNTREILTGPAILEFLEGLGARFCLTRLDGDRKAAIKPCDEHGYPLPGNYLDMPLTASKVINNLRTPRGGAGLLPEHSNGLTLLDIDAGLESFLHMFPVLTGVPRVFRANAPDRAKIIILIAEQGCKIVQQDSETPTRKAELLGRGHGNVAGRHPSGSAYELLTGTLLVFTRAEIVDMLNRWIPEAWNSHNKPPPSLVPRQALAQFDGNLLRDAIAWFNAQPGNRAAVEQLIAKRPHRGDYFSTRPDDDTPSTKLSGNGRTWFDYGGIPETLDVFEMYCRLSSGINKATYKWQVVNQWLVSQGKQPIPLR